MQNKTEKAYEFILDRIISGKYEPLSPIYDSEIQKEIGSSRTPVREALLKLRDQGFVYIYSNKVTLVSEMSLDLINEMYEARVVSEGEIYVDAARRIDRALMEQLRDQFVNPPAFANEEAKRLYYVELDDRLHESLIGAASNRFIKRMLDTVYKHNRRLRRFINELISIDEHVELIDAVLAGDPDRIRKATLKHLEGSKKKTLAAYNRGELKHMEV